MATTDPKHVELALQLAAINNGNATVTAKQLRERTDIKITAQTITRWMRGRYAQRYRELYEEYVEEARATAAQIAAEIADDAASLTRELVGKTREAMDDLEPRDRAPSARAISQVHAAMTEKTLLLQGQPTQRIAVDELPEILGELTSMGVIEGEAEEVADAQLAEVAGD